VIQAGKGVAGDARLRCVIFQAISLYLQKKKSGSTHP